MHKLIKEQLKDFQSGFSDFSKKKTAKTAPNTTTTSNKKMSFHPATRNKTTSPIVLQSKRAPPSKTRKLSPKSTKKDDKDDALSPLNETIISSLDLTAMTATPPQKTPRRMKKDDKSWKKGRAGGIGGDVGGVGGDDGKDFVVGFRDGSVQVCEEDYLEKFKCDSSRKKGIRKGQSPLMTKSFVNAALSPVKFDGGFGDYIQANSGQCRFQKKEKISDFIDFIELLSELVLIFLILFFF